MKNMKVLFIFGKINTSKFKDVKYNKLLLYEFKFLS